jgi:membrane protein required for colicin V production
VNWADYIILAVLGLSVLIGLWRGLISEVLALLIWVGAAWVTWTFGPSVSELYAQKISLPSARLAAGYATCFVGVLVGGVLLRFLVNRLVAGTGLSGTDRMLGMLFGLARGVLLVTFGVFLVSMTALSRDPWWQQSMLLPQFKGMAGWVGEQVPSGARRYLQQPSAVLDQMPSLPNSLPSLPGQLPSMQGTPGQLQGLPSQLQGLPSRLQGLPSQLQGLPSQLQGLPSQLQGLQGKIPALPGGLTGMNGPAPAGSARDPAEVFGPSNTRHP